MDRPHRPVSRAPLAPLLALLAPIVLGVLGACSEPEKSSGPPRPTMTKLSAPKMPVFQPQPPSPNQVAPPLWARGESGGATAPSDPDDSLESEALLPAPLTHAPPRLPRPAVAPDAGRPALPPPEPVVPLSAADIERHVRTLASDAMAGRDTGTPESLVAAGYLEGVLQRAGLRPAGDDKSFLQVTDVRGFTSDGLPELTALDANGATTPAVFGADFAFQDGGPIDRTLNVVVVRSAADVPRPPRADAALLLVGAGRQRGEWLEQAGAPGGRGFPLLLLGLPGPQSTPRTDPPHGLTVGGDNAPPTILSVRGPLRDRLASGELPRVHVVVRATDRWPAVNVVGVLDGAGTREHPELAQQAIVFSAHYDHLGLASPAAATVATPVPDPAAPPAAPPDLVYNGADDDASGVAAVLELAQAFGERARIGEPPARTLVFLLVTGEERGLLGTSYYLDHPVVPLAQTICNLNFEMIGRPDPLVGGAGRLWLTGFDRSNLGAAWAAAGLPVLPDPRLDQHFYERSDNYAFVERGIVGQSLSTYNLHTDYHTVRDEADGLDYAHMEGCVRAAFAAAETLADGSLTPAAIAPPAAPPAPEPPPNPTAPSSPQDGSSESTPPPR